MNKLRLSVLFCYVLLLLSGEAFGQVKSMIHPFVIADTGQSIFFDNRKSIPKPLPGQPFFGQDAQFSRHVPHYTDNGDGTITDHVTGLIWQKSFSVMTYDEAVRKAKTFFLSGQQNWRLPSIKEVYSLALFSGVDASSREMSGVPSGAKPFIDSVFDFQYGANGPRPIDTQLLSSTIYQGKTMGGQETVFGFNAADGRIKGYPVFDPRRHSGKSFTVRFVRGNSDYGRNNYQDNRDGTINDLATGLMWARSDSGKGMNWQNALEWVAQKNATAYSGYKDWRLPNAKELQSIVDYSRSPQKNASPAISPMFEVSAITVESGGKNYPFYWTSTTHQNVRGGFDAVYVCFGDAYGYFKPPGAFGAPRLMDVHGAGAQRSDPKVGDPSDFPQGRGPQGDVIRILNYVRLVRNM
jgi:Protein of unknown function (DUF1566)